MSTNRSVGRFTATHKKDRFAVAREKDRFTATHKKDRSGLCAFTFADGRQCRTPHHSGHPHLCYFHAQKEAEALAAKQAGKDISSFFFANLLTACDLSAAMVRLFSAVAQGQIKPKVASTLAYLSQTMLQSIPISQHEYCEAFSSDAWRKAVRSSFTPSAPAPQPAPKSAPSPHSPAPKPTPQPTPPPASQPVPPPAPQPKPQPVTQPTSKPAPPAPPPTPQPSPQSTSQPAPPPQSHQPQTPNPNPHNPSQPLKTGPESSPPASLCVAARPEARDFFRQPPRSGRSSDP